MKRETKPQVQQHYRAKDLPRDVARLVYTGLDDFGTTIARATHVIVDHRTYFELGSDERIMDFFVRSTPAESELGYTGTFNHVLVFTDSNLPAQRRWVSEDPWAKTARPNFIIVAPQYLKPFRGLDAASIGGPLP